MTTSDFLRALESTLELESGSIAGNETLSQLEWWDSLAALTFMAVADQELQVSISGGQLASCKTVRDLLSLLGDKVTP
jgi:acyl carrier protein